MVMPREGASSSVGQSSSSSSSAMAGPGPSTTASMSATASASSSALSSPANDLFRISLPDSTDVSRGKAISTDSYVAAARQRLAVAGSARFQDILEDASLALKARLASLDASDMSEKKKRRMFEEFMREMQEIAEMQEREVEARAREEAVLARTMLLSKNENGAGPSGSSSSGFSSSSRAAGPSNSNSNITANSSSSSTSPALQTSASSASAASSSGSASRVSACSSSSAHNKDDDSNSEEETDRPPPAPKNVKASAKAAKSKFGKLPPSLNTSPTSGGGSNNPAANASKKGSKDDDVSSSPSTPTPTQAKRGRSGTISLPRSVSASSAFPDEAPSHNKSKSSESVLASSNPNAKVNMADGEKRPAKGASKSVTSSPPTGSRPELLAGLGVSSSSAVAVVSTVPAGKPVNGTGAATKNVPTTVQNSGQNQKAIQQRPLATSTQPPAPSRANSSTNVTTKGSIQKMQTQTQTSNSNSAMKSPPTQFQAFQLAQSQTQTQTQSQIRAQPHSQPQSQIRGVAQDDSVVGYRPKDTGHTNQSASHKLWIPPKPPHMQSPAQSASHVHTLSSTSNATASAVTAEKNGKETKEGKVVTDSTDSKEKKPRPVSFASQGTGISLTGTAKGSGTAAEKAEKEEKKIGVGEKEVKESAKQNAPASDANAAPVKAASTVTKSTSGSVSGDAAAPVQPVKAEGQASSAPATTPSVAPNSSMAENVKTQSTAGNGSQSMTGENVTSSPQSSPSSISTATSIATTATAPALVASIPPTPTILHSGLSSASSSEAATAEIERERLRAEKALLSTAQFIPQSAVTTAVTNSADAKSQLQPAINLVQPHAHSHTHAYSPPIQQQQQIQQKGVSTDATNLLYSHLYPFVHTNANANSTGATGAMSPSTSGSTITSPFSPLSMANGFPSSSAATSAASSRAISRHASSSSSDPYAQKDSYAYSQGHGHHRGSNKEKDKLAQAAAALMVGAQPPTQTSMFWQPGPNERERGQRERERDRDRNRGRTPSANNSAHSSSASAASSRSSSVSRHDGPVFGGFDPSTIRSTGRPGQGIMQVGNGAGNGALDAAFASFMEGAPAAADRSSNAIGGSGKLGPDTKIWVPGTAKDATPKASRRGDRDRTREGGNSASSPSIHPLSLTLTSMSSSTSSSSLVPSTASTISNASTSQAQFYAVAERAREDRLRVRANEFHSRAEVVAVFQRRVEDLMAEFAEALMRADEYEKFGPSSALTKPGSS